MIKQTGEASVEEFDGSNIPVDIWVTELEDYDEEYKEGFRYKLRAANYMPRKSAVWEPACEYVATSREELTALIKEHFLPMYERAVSRINKIIVGTADNLYYWPEKDEA